MRLSSPSSLTANVLIVRRDTEVEHREETASRIERIRRQPADIVTGEAQRRICASH